MSGTAPPEGVGQIQILGEQATLHFQRRLPHPPERVWQALTDPRELVGWYLTDATIEGRNGGRVDLRAGPSRLHVTGRILRWEPPRRLEHEWNIAPCADLPAGEAAQILWELEPADGGTLLRLTHSRLHRPTALGFAPGTHAFLDRLTASLAGAPQPDWVERYKAVAPSYPPSWNTPGGR